MPLDARKYYLIRGTNGASVMCMRGTDSPKLVSGGARYNIVNRSRRRSSVEWDGDDPYRMDVSVLLDGWMNHTSVEHDVALLNSMRQSPGDLTPPVQVYIDGALPVKGGKWVLEGIDWGDTVIWATDTPNSKLGDFKSNGYRVRQDAILHMLQSVQPKILQVNTPNIGYAIVLKAQQTLAQIAKDWNVTVQEILKANNMRDSKAIKPGQHLVVPGNPFNLPIQLKPTPQRPTPAPPKPSPAKAQKPGLSGTGGNPKPNWANKKKPGWAQGSNPIG
jgi:LysM repeat protein